MRCFTCVLVALLTSLGAFVADWASAAPLPNDPNLVLWMRADNGVTGSAPVTAIADSSTHGNNLTAAGSPQLTTRTFATGVHDVIRFNGSSFFYISNSIPLDLANLSIYLVGTQKDGSAASQTYVGNYGPSFSGYALGISDAGAHKVKFYTSHGNGSDSLEPFTLPDETPYMLTATIDSTGSKDLYLNNGPSFHVAGANPTYGFTNQFSIGALSFNGNQVTPGTGYIQGMIGDIAEVLIYKNVDAAQRADVQAYLQNKYFAVPEPSVCVLAASGLLIGFRTARRAHRGLRQSREYI
jgi:hypothetical protein